MERGDVLFVYGAQGDLELVVARCARLMRLLPLKALESVIKRIPTGLRPSAEQGKCHNATWSPRK